ncbi:hypothetical protein A9Q84_14220 [Halobacteriovorax marinus]|uniref:Cyclic nucleotide-binding domain-containing protein n=1 Tax=Halobacteriovorax marinus TaxID=97084 RepID=A0A1Y5FAJ6_9BACT|nr:hypothetical protein A9Q84_14220 [Halobacteriovorax marinus]
MSTQNNLFMQIGKKQLFKKGDYIFRQGDIDSNIYFIKSGLLKAYYLTGDGKEFVKSFLDVGELIGSIRSASKNIPCYFNVVCLEDTEVASVSFDELLNQSKADIENALVLIDSLIELSAKKEKREYEFLCLSAQERYDVLQTERPELLKRISLNDTAKYLGITAIALSRIRKRMG